MEFSLIAAVDKDFGIGKKNGIPWRLPEDTRHFAEVTTTVKQPGKMNAVVMGSRTWESLPLPHRPLRNRLNIVLSRDKNLNLPEGVILCKSLEEAMEIVEQNTAIENVFIIGGGKVYEEAIKNPKCHAIFLTQLNQSFDCDTFFPRIDGAKFRLKERSEIKKNNGLEFEFLLYEKIR
jgi:dihydrofolate reductase